MISTPLKRIALLFLLTGAFIPGLSSAQDDYYGVFSASPNMALQGTINLDVEIIGDNFDRSIDSLEFIALCSDLSESCSNPDWVHVNRFVVRGKTKIIANIDVPVTNEPLPLSYKGHDVQIKSSSRGRGGKGTTLFKVQSGSVSPSECNYNFEAKFDDLDMDGVTSDRGDWSDDGVYDAIGGKGFRLDTNGSQKLERQNDTRFVFIDFSDAIPNSDCDFGSIHNPAGAAGFCAEYKGVDLRIEHTVQDLETYGLCTMAPGESRRLAMKLGFKAGEGALIQDTFDRNGKETGNGDISLWLSYGCLGYNLLQQDIDLLRNWPLVTRIDDTTWRIKATRACMHTTHGNMLVDDAEDILYLDMPFGLTITI